MFAAENFYYVQKIAYNKALFWLHVFSHLGVCADRNARFSACFHFVTELLPNYLNLKS